MNKKIFIILFCIYYLLGIVSNYTRTRMPETILNNINILIGSLVIIAWLVYCFILFFRQGDGANILGLTIGKKPLIAIVVSIIFLVISLFYQFQTSSMSTSEISLSAMGATVEEFIFRGLLFNFLITSFSDKKQKVFWAMLISSVLFGIGHIPSYGLSFAFSLVITALLLIAIYYWTKSTIVGIVVHVTANAGLTAAFVVFVLYLIIALIGNIKNKHSQIEITT